MGVIKVLALVIGFYLPITCTAGTLRCGSALISIGDLTEHVRGKCGPPGREQSEGPALRNNGVPKLNAAKISTWIYGPRNGAYQYLRFIDDKLVAVEIRRQ